MKLLQINYAIQIKRDYVTIIFNEIRYQELIVN